MKKTSKLFYIAVLVLLFDISGCDSGSGSTYEPEPTGVPSIDDLVGTWNNQGTLDTTRGRTTVICTLDIAKTDDSSASFARLSKIISEDTKREKETYYMAEEGRITLNESGIITEWVDRRRITDTPPDDTIPWDNMENYGDSYSIAILNSVLYFSPFKRVGTGNGLAGTWAGASTHYYSGLMEATRVTIEITSSTISLRSETSEDGIEYSQDEAYGPASYTNMGNVIMTDLLGEKGAMPYILSGDWLVMSSPNVTSTTSFGWVKQ